MTTHRIKADISQDIHKVWKILSEVWGYPIWRRDVEKTVTTDENQFTVCTKDGYSTMYTVIRAEPCRCWEADVENSHVKGRWTIELTSRDGETEIDITACATAKRLSTRPVGKSVFEKTYLQKELERFAADLENAAGKTGKTEARLKEAVCLYESGLITRGECENKRKQISEDL